MTQTPQNPKRWFVPYPEKKAITGHPCQDACNGNLKMGQLLKYFLSEASWELERQDLPESCKVVKFTRLHDHILKRVNISEKSLVQFLKQFNTWGFVLSESYGKVFTVQADPIHKAMYQPVFTKKPRGKKFTSTSEKSTTSTSTEESCNVYQLQEKVEALQLYNIGLEVRLEEALEALKAESCKVVELQKNVEASKLYNSALSAWISAVSEALKIPAPFIDSVIDNDFIDSNREKDSVDAARIDTPAPILSSGSQDGYMNHSEDIIVEAQGVPVTYSECLAYLQQHGIPTEALDAVEVMQAARTLYVQQYPSQGPSQKGQADGASINDHPVPGISTRQVASDLDRGIYSETEALEPAAPKIPFEPPGRVRLPSKQQITPSQQTPEVARMSGIVPPTDAPVPTQTNSEPSASGDMQAASAPPVTTPSGSASEGAGVGGHQTTLFGQQEEQKTGKGKRGKKDGDVTQGKEESPAPPQMPSKDAPWGTNTCKQLFDYWRGKPLLSTYQLGESSKLAKALAQNYTREQVENSRNYMHDEAEWWSEHPEKVDIFSVAKHIHEMLEKMGQKTKPEAAMNGNGAHPTTSVSGRRRLDLDDDPPLSRNYSSRPRIQHA